MAAKKMSVYVDDMAASFGRMKMCHMIADTPEELVAMADRLKLRREWIQDPGTAYEHFDISKTKRAQAIEFGAVELTQRELVGKIKAREATS